MVFEIDGCRLWVGVFVEVGVVMVGVGFQVQCVVELQQYVGFVVVGYVVYYYEGIFG